jgi:hypothetical protein
VDLSPVSLVYEAFEAALWRRTFADEMSEPLIRALLPLRREGAARRTARSHRESPIALVRRPIHRDVVETRD